jgi:hypothetical protein
VSERVAGLATAISKSESRVPRLPWGTLTDTGRTEELRDLVQVEAAHRHVIRFRVRIEHREGDVGGAITSVFFFDEDSVAG